MNNSLCTTSIKLLETYLFQYFAVVIFIAHFLGLNSPMSSRRIFSWESVLNVLVLSNHVQHLWKVLVTFIYNFTEDFSKISWYIYQFPFTFLFTTGVNEISYLKLHFIYCTAFYICIYCILSQKKNGEITYKVILVFKTSVHTQRFPN